MRALTSILGLATVLALGILGLACGGDGEATRYEVTVNFNTSVTQNGIDEVDELLRAYDEDLDFVVMESWPPIGRALLETDAADFCETVEAQLEAKTYVDAVSCGPA